MKAMKYCLGAAAGALALSLATLAAEAAPVGGASVDLKASAGSASSIEKAAYRRCWWHHGHRHCRWVGGGYYSDYDYPYYYGPGVGFYFGGGRHWGGHHHHHHH